MNPIEIFGLAFLTLQLFVVGYAFLRSRMTKQPLEIPPPKSRMDISNRR